jgi:hypothetical protein
MKNKHRSTSILSAIAYLIERKGLTAAQVQVLLKETIDNLEQ